MLALLLTACAVAGGPAFGPQPMAEVPKPGPGQEVAVLAGGCFWCLEADFDKLPGVVATTSGYAGGTVEHPTYEQVGLGGTGHTEVVHVVYDTSKLSYDEVLTWFWRHVDPTDGDGQFCDRGSQYRPAIFPVDAAQEKAALASRKAIEEAGWLPAPIRTEIATGRTFWPAEVYHQDFHRKNPARYLPYRKGCGRDARVAEVWAKAPPLEAKQAP